jgi:ribosome maturation factor RimP
MESSTVTQRVWEVAEPLALALGLEVVDVQYRPEAGRMMLRLLIDRPAGGVTLDELARVSRELSDLLDAHDTVPGRFYLECSSPGVNRPLLREAHFRRAVGERVRIRARAPIGDRRQFRGTLEAVTVDGVTIQDPDVGIVFIEFDAVEKAHIDHDFSRPAGPPHAHA